MGKKFKATVFMDYGKNTDKIIARGKPLKALIQFEKVLKAMGILRGGKKWVKRDGKN